MNPRWRLRLRWLLTLLAVAALLAGLISNAVGAIALGNASGTQGTGVSSLTWSHGVASGSNRLLVVRTAHINSGVSVSGVTYGGVALTQLQSAVSGSGSSHLRASVWYLVAPAVGSANVVVTLSGTTRVLGYSNDLTGVSQSTPFGAATTATGTGSAVSVTASGVAGDLMIDVAAAQGGAGSVTAGAGQSAISGSTGATASDVLGMGSTKAGAASVNLSWSMSAPSPWVSIGVAIRQDGAVPISGTVFEDLNYGGGSGRSQSAGGGVGVAGARVELYDGSGAYLAAATTAAGGSYTFGGVASGAYTVRVVNSTVLSSRSGATASLVGVQTYRSEAAGGTATAVTDEVGGLNPVEADTAAGSNGTTLWTLCASEGATCSFSGRRIVRYGAYSGGSSRWTTRVLTGGTSCSNGVFGDPYSGIGKSCYVLNATYQSVANVAVGSSAVTAVDFGFNFSTIVNVNDAGQGSLRQFITNANALGGKAALAQAGSRRDLTNAVQALPPATETSIFMVARGAAVAGLRSTAPSQLTGGVAPIVVTTTLPQVTAASVSLDGSTQTANVGDTNAGLLGTGGTVGTDELPLSQVAKPEVEVTFASLSRGIDIGANNVTVRKLALRATGVSPLGNGAVSLANDVTGALIEANIMGTPATALVDPGAGQYIGSGVISNGADSATVRNNLIAYFTSTGVQLTGTLSANWTISGNEIRDGGLDFDNTDGIALSNATGATVSGNRITGMSTQGIVFGSGAGSGTQIVNNTFSGNGVGPTNGPSSQSNVLVARSGATNVRVEANVISANHGAGIAINDGATGIALTRNLVYGNGTIASRNGTAPTGQIDIDLNAPGDDANLGTAPFVTINDTGDPDAGGNNLQNHPVLSSAVISGGTQLIVSGTLNTNANGYYRIEFFGNTSPNGSGRGGGQSYLGFANLSTDGSGNGSFSTTLTATAAIGSYVTATATKSDSAYATLTDSSEYSPNVRVGYSLQGTVFEDLNYGGGAGRTRAASGGVGLNGARVELYDSGGAFVSATTTAGGGAYRFDLPATGAYLLRVVSGSVPSSRTGYVAGLVGVLTYRADASSGSVVGVTDFVGGTNPAVADPGNGGSGTVLNPSTHVFSAGLSGTAQAVAPITVSSASVAGIDFGFNFDTVVNVNNGGQGSLRQVLTNAEALGGDATLSVAGRTAALEHVVFMIGNGTAAAGLRSSINLFSGGVATVSLATGLPVLASRLVIDAQTQPGWVQAPIVQLNGSAVGGTTSGLTVNGAASVVRGLVINRFGGEGVYSTAGAGLVIQGNHIGTNAAGSAAAANARSGIAISSSAGGHMIGGSTAAQRNVISGNGIDGVSIAGGIGSVVSGNHIGVNAAGTATVGNGSAGVRLQGASSDATIGGASAGMANVIGGNGGAGVVVLAGSSRNAILLNSIYANGGPGIDLNGDGPSANDGAKTAGQGNLLMDSPVFSSARSHGSRLTLDGYIGTAAGQSLFGNSRVDVFISDASSANGSGRTWLGVLTADASGNFSGTVTMPYNALRAGSVLTGTATDTSNNSSEFGANFSGLVVDWVINHNGDGVDANPGDGLCETSTPGQCTLRAAIMETNAWAGADVAVFELPNCPGAGCTITPASALPTITGQLTIDGQTQPGWTSRPLVVLDGGGAGSNSNGLRVSAGNSTLRGLTINGFGASGILLETNGGNTVAGCYIGTNAAGTAARANGRIGVEITSANNTVGGSTAGAGNLISGNTQYGVSVSASAATGNVIRANTIGLNEAGNAALSNGGFGIVVDFQAPNTQIIGNVISGNTNPGWSAAQGGIYLYAGATTIRSNIIGMDATGTSAIANGRAVTNSGGIFVTGGSTGIVIGGTTSGEGNLIGGNIGDGVLTDTSAVQASILSNAFRSNSGLGIDLRNDGVNANDGVKSAGQPNLAMDHPVITSAGYDPGTRALTVTGYVGTGTGQAVFAGARIELFTSDGDASGYGEGSAYVGTLTADANGRFAGTVSVSVAVNFAVGTALTGTATDTSNNTSEFGPNYVSTTMSALAPSRFNAFETSTAAGALTGVLQTRVAGVASNFAVIAIDNTGTALQTAFAGSVTLEWMNAADNSGALDAGNCRASWVASGSAGSTTFVSGDQGRRNATLTPATVGREWRLRISYAGPGGTVTSCAGDPFAVRPASLAITGVSDSNDTSAGTTRALDNLAASGGRVHRAGRPFSLRAAAHDAASAVTTGYNGTPAIAITACVLPAGCTAGALSAPSLVASGGLIAADTLSYSEVGAVNLQLTDDSFADVDAADTPLAQRRVQSAVLGVGRFVPDRYLLTVGTNPQFATQQGSCAAAGQGFTYVGQSFGWATTPSFTVTAQNAAGGATTLWSGALQKLTTAHISRSLAAANTQGLTPSVAWGGLTLTTVGGGVASVALGGDQFLFARDVSAPVPSFNPVITLGVAVSDTSEVAVSGNTAVASTSALVFGSGSGIAFNMGATFHYGRLKLQNAFGDVRRGVRANVELQKFTDRGWLRLSEDNNCMTVPLASIAFSAGSGAFAGNVCNAPASTVVPLSQGRGTLVLPASPGNVQGAALVTLNIGPTLEGNACTAGVPVTPTSAAWPHLLGARGSGATQDQNPAARLVWGRQHRDFMVLRELF